MAIVALETEAREERKKGPARRTRMAGKIPAVLYGQGQHPALLAVDARQLDRVLQQGRGNLILELSLGGGDGAHTSIIRELQRDPVSGRVLHVDFQRISLTQTIHREIPVHLTGTAVGVKDMGGILDFVRREIAVEGMPTQIPDAIEVDVTALKIGDSIHARELSAPNVKILTDPDAVVVHVVPPSVYQEAEKPEGAPTEPEVVQKEKAPEAEE